jgi:hypothetical protein
MKTDGELNKTMNAMFQAVAQFALVASQRFGASDPEQYAQIRKLFDTGLGELQATVVLSPHRQVELALVIGTEKHPYLTVLAQEVEQKIGGGVVTQKTKTA